MAEPGSAGPSQDTSAPSSPKSKGTIPAQNPTPRAPPAQQPNWPSQSRTPRTQDGYYDPTVLLSSLNNNTSSRPGYEPTNSMGSVAPSPSASPALEGWRKGALPHRGPPMNTGGTGAWRTGSRRRQYSCEDDSREMSSLHADGKLRHTGFKLYTGPDSSVHNTPVLHSSARNSISRQHSPPLPEDATPFDDLPDAVSIASSAESLTLRDRQDAINENHPFGIRVWKPALYKKHRSVENTAEEDIRSRGAPLSSFSAKIGNTVWIILFGLPLYLITTISALALWIVAGWASHDVRRYARLIYSTGLFVLFPFRTLVQLYIKEAYRDEDEGVGRSFEDFFAWQYRDDRDTPDAVFAPPRITPEAGQYSRRRRLFGRGRWTIGRILFFSWYWLLFAPIGYTVGLLCWMSVFAIPMGRLIFAILKHLRVHPLALRYRAWGSVADVEDQPDTTIVLSCHRAFGSTYYKYTISGSPVVFVNLMAVVVFVLLDSMVLGVLSQGTRFILSLLSIIPLAYFIGQAVASVSAQSSMTMGATVNAFFSTVVEVFLYLVALQEGKGKLVEGAIIGSFLAGVVLMPGISMIGGAFFRKTQRFNPRSTAVTTTMLFFAATGTLAPTIWYRAYGPDVTHCFGNCGTPQAAPSSLESITQLCRCYVSKLPLNKDEPIYQQIIRPFSILCAVLLFLGYLSGLVFTLRTHAAMIWAGAADDHEEGEDNGHGAPNWDRRTSYIVLLGATWLYALVAEVLIQSVDVVLEHISISQKLLGITVFALVPNTTEFMNAISFALQGNVSLSLEIGSAYALQVCLLQIPALVLWSLRYIPNSGALLGDTVYTMMFSSWDVWAALICVFLYANVQAEAKSNYFKGVILVLAYIVAAAGYYFDTEGLQ